jgi:hypothetical protein
VSVGSYRVDTQLRARRAIDYNALSLLRTHKHTVLSYLFTLLFKNSCSVLCLLVLYLDQLLSRLARRQKGRGHILERDQCQGIRNAMANHDATLETVAHGTFTQLLLYTNPSSRFGSKLRLGWMEWLSESFKSWQ